MKYNSMLVVFCLLVFGLSTFAQKVPDKPYNQWGKEETLKIVNESAWAKTYVSTAAATAAAQGQAARDQSQSVFSGGNDPRSIARNYGPPPIWTRLHSALPLRQALVRLQQLDQGYDKMSDAEKTAWDASKKGFLECGICKDYYVITITKARDASRSTVEEGVFQGMTYDDLKGNVKLVNDAGEERELIQFNAPKGPSDMTVFYFKRTDEAGKPFLTKDSKDFKIVFKSDFLDTKNRFAILIPNSLEFKVSKLLINDKLMF